ncbi:MAG: ATP-binding protein [Candidatus Anoxymicrobium japonicum]|uniref:ATP-binding protein n=1 Tax=Candidatus Anoxymicrobium japonicum TaxID=2013648 RepID=A0A2N3G7B0_9ACTN|nr:MAG: ATP-binding protein [Candidatus Anoxymicrobium japonicum]
MIYAEGSRPSGEREVIDFVSKITEASRRRIEEKLPHGFVRLKVAEAERRQAQQDIRSVEDIVCELARNSRDAGARHVLVAFQKEKGRFRSISVLDDGCGIPTDMHQMVFEPRVTSKREDFEEDRYGVHGRGMALFSIRSRSISARIVSSSPNGGTVISVLVDTLMVPERSDQATLPIIEEKEVGLEIGAGSHNVARVLSEMSTDSRNVDYYLGSVAEILATARMLSTDHDTRNSPWANLARIDDIRLLAEVSKTRLGLSVSERNAYRVVNGEIVPLETMLKRAKDATGISRKACKASPGADGIRSGRLRSPLRKLSKDDLSEIGERCGQIVEGVLGRYYMKPAGTIRIRRGKGKIVMSFFIIGEDGDGE